MLVYGFVFSETLIHDCLIVTGRWGGTFSLTSTITLLGNPHDLPDLTPAAAGPFATKLLGEFSADVIKLEPPAPVIPFASGESSRTASRCGGMCRAAPSAPSPWTCAAKRAKRWSGDFKRLMGVIGRADLAEDPALAHNDGRSRRAQESDAAIEAWTRTRGRDEILTALDDARVLAGYPYTAADIASDPHYLAREMIQTITRPNGKSLRVPGVLPRLSDTPGRLGSGGPELGAHTDEVLDELGIDDATRAKLRDAGII